VWGAALAPGRWGRKRCVAEARDLSLARLQ
jgi:hypothetical protein